VAGINLGLVGINARARNVVIPGFAASDQCRVVAVCSRDVTKATDAAGAVDGSMPFSDYDDMLRLPALDTVFINTPAAQHHPLALRALRAGKHVICEKPLAETVAQAEEMTLEAARMGVRTAVNFTLRSLPGPRTVARLLEQGDIGTLISFELMTYQSRGLNPSLPKQSALADLGPHVVDLLSWWAAVAGAGHVEQVAATMTDLDDGRPGAVRGGQLNVAMQASVRLTGQASGLFGIVRVAPGFGNAYRASLFGTRGTVEMFYDTEAPVVRVGKEVGHAVHEPWTTIPIPADLIVSFKDFPRVHFGRIAAALAGRDTFPTFEDGLRAQRLLDALETAGRTGAWVLT